MKNNMKKIPDHLVDSCKHSSINQMAAGLRLPRSNFSNTLYLTGIALGRRTGRLGKSAGGISNTNESTYGKLGTPLVSCE